jgi:methyltransferase
MASSYPGVLTVESIESLIRTYFDACNEADAAKIAACFVPDGVHYFPPGMYGGPFRGADGIADRWVDAVATFGSIWTVDQIIADPSTGRAVAEWTHFKTFAGSVLRGDEWYDFDAESGLIREIRAYYASPQDPSLDRLELGGFDYDARGYPRQPSFTRTR